DGPRSRRAGHVTARRALGHRPRAKPGRAGRTSMRKLLIPTLIALGAALPPQPATAVDFDPLATPPGCPILINPRMIQDMRQAAAKLNTSTHVPNDTTWVGYNPAYAGSNYWSIGVGHRFPPGNTSPVPDADTGYWDWDHPVHGDSLQGWWPV